MSNRKVEETWRYHSSTKHPGMPPHYLDWDNQPIPFKIYKTLNPIKLPTNRSFSNISVLQTLNTKVNNNAKELIPDLSTIAQILFLSAGITKKKKYPGGEISFRAAACTGALYHIDIYIVTTDIKDLERSEGRRVGKECRL